MAKKFNKGIDVNGQPIVNTGTATQPDHAVPYGQLLSRLNGNDWGLHARLASTSNINIASPGANFDGVAANTGDRIFALNQTDATARLVYIYNGPTTAMTIAPDFANGVLSSERTFGISEGATLGEKAWTLTTDGNIVVGTTSLVWGQNFSGSVYTNGDGILLLSGQFSIDHTKVPKLYSVVIGDGTTISFTINHSLGTKLVSVSIIDNTTGEEVEADIGARGTQSFPLNFATAPAAGQYSVLVLG